MLPVTRLLEMGKCTCICREGIATSTWSPSANSSTDNVELYSSLILMATCIPDEQTERPRTLPELLAVVNYFENSYLGQVTPEGPRTSPFTMGLRPESTEPVLQFRNTSGLSECTGGASHNRFSSGPSCSGDKPPPRSVGVLTATCSLSALVMRITPQLLSICSPLPRTWATL